MIARRSPRRTRSTGTSSMSRNGSAHCHCWLAEEPPGAARRITDPHDGARREAMKGPAAGLIGQVLLLAGLAATAGLGAAGWLVGIASAVTIAALLARARPAGLGPASRVTLVRATLAVGVAALAADSFSRDTPVALLVTLAAVALVLDLIDGWVARRTGAVTALGARFDGE